MTGATIDPVAVLGAGGTMGSGMASNLLAAGLTVRAWDRTRAKAAPLGEAGAQICQSPAEAAAGASAIITMLPDADAVLAVIGDAAGGLGGDRSEALWVQMSTIGEQGTERCSEFARERAIAFIDAPVLGTKQPAEEGKLVVLASGPDEFRKPLEPLFNAVGQRTMWVGAAGGGSALKLVVNSWLVAVAEGAAEAIALAEALGLDPALFLEAIAGGPLDGPYLRMKAEAMIKRDFEQSFALRLAGKDARLAEQAGERRGLELPALAAISKRMEEALAQHGDEDVAALYLQIAGGS